MSRIATTWLLLVSCSLAGCFSNGDPAHHAHHADDPAHQTGHAASAPDDVDHAHPRMPRRILPEGAGAPLFADLGDHRMEISSRSTLAQRYFSQGLLLGYGFNHAEALRSYREAYAQDSTCGICAWGEAYVLGPNINKPMDDADVPAAYEASRRALASSEDASPLERDLIQALAVRYRAEPVADRSDLDRAYAEAMRSVAARYPDHPDVQTLFAEAVMDTMPWDYYIDASTLKPEAKEASDALERVIAAHPRHPGALHFYIHLVEPSNTPERGEFAADRLGSLAPGAGHLVHMPSHIYLRVGRYHDASEANERAASADESYITQCRAQGFYPAVYYPHNVHFLYASAAFEGRSGISIGAARRLSRLMTPDVVAEVPIAEEFVPMEAFALARFARWDEASSLPRPPTQFRYATGVWHYVRGMGHASQGRTAAARRELEALESIASEDALQDLYFSSGSTPAQLLRLGSKVLQSKLASQAAQADLAIAALEEAVALQDSLPYTEPPPWYFPTREALGATLIEAGQPARAEAIYREQLEHTPRNGWSLHGLATSLRAQRKLDAAREIEALQREVWQRADIEL